MIRSSSHLNEGNFFEKIALYSKGNGDADDQTVLDLCTVVAQNMKLIQGCVGCSQQRQQLSEFAERIKEYFPGNKEVEEVALDICHYVNAYFFSVCDPLKHIFSYLIQEKISLKPPSGLRDVESVSCLFYKCASEVKKQWVEDRLISLKIYGLKSATEAIEFIKTHHFTRVNLNDFKDFTDEDLVKLGKACPSLQELHILHSEVTEDGVVEFAKECPHLTGILLPFRIRKDKAAVALAESCPRLTEISFSYPNVIGRLEELAKYEPVLKTLDISYAMVSDKGVMALAKHCFNLIVIKLSNTNVTDKGVMALANGCPNLIVIYLNGTKVTEEGLKALAEGCPDLKVIYISNPNITEEWIEDLEEAYPELQIIQCPKRNGT